MRNKKLRTYSCLLFLFLFSSPAHSQTKYWIEFGDKGISPSSFHKGNPLFDRVFTSLSKEALLRRSQTLVKPIDQTITVEDAPIFQHYLRLLSKHSVHILGKSKWMNAVSAYLTKGQIRTLSRISCIKAICPVSRSAELSMQPLHTLPQPLTTNRVRKSSIDARCGYDDVIYHYGNAEVQLDSINVWPLHAMGLSGSGVRLGVLDVGFRWRENSSLKHLRVINEYDYIFHDSVTENEIGDNPGQDDHGTHTLSMATGFVPDTLIGPAYNATILLAKTEDVRSEHHVEEDNYAAAIEDMEARGVDITSSSLGYFKFDPPDTSYQYADMNGHTTIVAQAVARAAKLGVLCVTAMGNNGGDTIEAHLNSPADADSILGVGALRPENVLAGFSAHGPSSDGRIKPDVCAPGVAVWGQNRNGDFDSGDGTSYATPLTAAVCCLLKEAHPEVSAQDIRRALMLTADRAEHPDTLYGWGRINAYAAALSLGPFIHVKNTWIDTNIHLCIGAASNAGVQQVFVTYSRDTLSASQTLRAELTTDSLIYSVTIPAVVRGDRLNYRISMLDSAGVTTTFPKSGWTTLVLPTHPQVSVFPNPASSVVQLNVNTEGEWKLYDAAGRAILNGRIATPMFNYPIATQDIADGTYFLQFIAGSGESQTVTVVVAH
jgi:serine protease AprX